jgi:hypothetical protein
MRYRFDVRSILKFLALLLLLAQARHSFGIPASDLKENYQSIIDRNPFGLKPPPPPPTNNINAAPKQEKPKSELFLTGITSIAGPRQIKQVYLKLQEQGKKEPVFYTLSEGVEKDGIKILDIDAVSKKVKITRDNEEKTLSFETDGVPAPAASAGKPGAPGQPGHPGAMPPPLPGVVHPIGAPNSAIQPNRGASIVPNAASYRQIPSRRIRGMSSGSSAGYSGSTITPTPLGSSSSTPVQQPEIDPAEQYLRMNLDKTIKERQGIIMPPLPPVPR